MYNWSILKIGERNNINQNIICILIFNKKCKKKYIYIYFISNNESGVEDGEIYGAGEENFQPNNSDAFITNLVEEAEGILLI